jgi:hypothetical protein
LIFVVLLLIAGITLQLKNKRLTEVNSKLLLQNDSVLSVNLQLQKELIRIQHGLDSMHLSRSQRFTSR